MVESFKEFLRKKKQRVVNPIEVLSEHYVVPQKDLGEWAWKNGGKQFVKSYKQDWLNIELKDYLYYANYLLRYFPSVEKESRESKTVLDVKVFLIAVACLGEKEIKKRLKELRK